MRSPRVGALPGFLVAAMLPLGPAAVEKAPPLDSGLVEKVEVRLVILDVLVLDRKGNPVPGLVQQDFDVEVNGRSVPLASLDVSCSDVQEKPSIVLAFDYQHLDEVQRGRVLDSVERALDAGQADGAEVMVAALTGGLRVEQPFTKDSVRIVAALKRMQNDVSLWAGNFSHRSEDGFVRGLTSLFDVLGTFSRPKAVILFSAMRDVPLEEQFRQLAAQAAASRCAMYPVDVRGLLSEIRPDTKDKTPKPVRAPTRADRDQLGTGRTQDEERQAGSEKLGSSPGAAPG